MHAFSICATALEKRPPPPSHSARYNITSTTCMTAHTATTTITTAQLHDNAYIQYMRHCFRKKTTSTSISHSASYNITSNHHYHHHYHHDHHSTNYNACIQYMHHCFRKKTTSTSITITQCKLQYYVQPPQPPPLPPSTCNLHKGMPLNFCPYPQFNGMPLCKLTCACCIVHSN